MNIQEIADNEIKSADEDLQSQVLSNKDPEKILEDIMTGILHSALMLRHFNGDAGAILVAALAIAFAPVKYEEVRQMVLEMLALAATTVKTNIERDLIVEAILGGETDES